MNEQIGQATSHTLRVVPTLAIAFFFFSFVFFLFGQLLVNALPVVRKLRAVKKPLEDVPLHLTRLNPQPIEAAAFSKREYQEVTDPPTWTLGRVKLKHCTLAEVIDLLHARHSDFEHTIWELRGYAAILVFLGIVGFLRFLGHQGFAFDYWAFQAWVEDHPLELIALFELIMIALFVAKLWAELSTLKRLLNRH